MRSKRNITGKMVVLGLMAVILAAGILSGCTKNETVQDVTVSVIMDAIKDKVDISEMREADSKKLEKLYGININEIVEFALFTAPTNLRADEIAVFKLKDTETIDDIKEKIAKRIEYQREDFKDYLPVQYSLIENNIVKDKGNYILFAISEKVDEIEDAFNEALN